MPRVTVRPSGIEIEVDEGEPVAEAAWRQDLVWPTQCWGQLQCMACFTKILDGERDAVPAESGELDAIRLQMVPKLANDPTIRLGCQLRCTGSGLVLEKRGVRPVQDSDNNAL